MFPRMCTRIYTRKKREFHLFLTLLQGFAIPHTVEKQPKSTPDMPNPPHPMSEAWIYNIPTWTFIAVVTTVC